MRSMTKKALALAWIAFVPSVAFAQAANDSGGAVRAETPDAAESFARTAAVSGLFEVQASQLALERSKDAAIREFAQMMITDHTKADGELRQTAGTMTLPKTLDPSHQALIDALKAAGPNFDTLYVEQQIAAHKEAVALFTRFSETGPNGALRGLAAKLLPTLQHHQEMAGALKPS
ncbi:MAG TPA: DUF4142 domain-containing protein [Kaistia sp.]|nr:DUF4142 domain-containing protein [Kaistia sp.]